MRQTPGKCVCTGTKAEHGSGGGNLLQVPSQPFGSAGMLPASPRLLVSTPGHLSVDPGPILHTFSQPQRLSGTVSEQRAASAGRATTRNGRGLPANPSTSIRGNRGNRTRVTPLHVPKQTTSKLNCFVLPLHVSPHPPLGFGI